MYTTLLCDKDTMYAFWYRGTDDSEPKWHEEHGLFPFKQKNGKSE